MTDATGSLPLPIKGAKAIFFLPLDDNDGSDLTHAWKGVEDDLFLAFIGWTFLGEVEGAYRMIDGTKAMDHHRAYSVFFSDGDIPGLEEILSRFKAKTTQEAIYLEINYHVELRLI